MRCERGLGPPVTSSLTSRPESHRTTPVQSSASMLKLVPAPLGAARASPVAALAPPRAPGARAELVAAVEGSAVEAPVATSTVFAAARLSSA